MTTPILLTGYDAGRCARRIHNEWDPLIEKGPWEVPEALQLRFDAGREHEDAVLAELRLRLDSHRWVDLREIRGKQAAIDATVVAMAAGVEVIMGGWLPDDVEGGRTGRPDLLLRVGDGAYVPGDAKWHLMTTAAAKGRVEWSSLADPAVPQTLVGRKLRVSQRLDDQLQLAHYWRMLEAIGRSAGTPRGFIIGTDDFGDLVPGGRALTWFPLDQEVFETFSRSEGTKKRTALERYDHEHGFRVEVARTSAAGEPALVQPIFTDECDSCPWLAHCESIAAPGVASAAITSGRLDVREWRALIAVGVETVDELAALDVDDAAFAQAYLPEVSHRKAPLERVRNAVRRAQMLREGLVVERITEGIIDVPRADIEIDLDVEWDPDDRVYLWGALVSRAGESHYRPFVAWEPLDEMGELALANEFAGWLRRTIAAAEAEGRSLRVYHYSAVEAGRVKTLIADAGDLLNRFVDLLTFVRRHYFGLEGLGIKHLAPAFGFEWRDDDPGGLQSQLWLIEARGEGEGADDARTRILAYNEDDVRATWVVRDGMSGRAEPEIRALR